MTAASPRRKRKPVSERADPRPVVLDANVFVAAQWNPRSASAHVLRLCEDGLLRLCHTASIRREVYATLRNTRAPAEFVSRVRSLFNAGSDMRTTRRIRLVEDDPEDDKYLECAVAAGATIITNDQHLLRVGGCDGVEILRPTEFAKRTPVAGTQV